ncbi:MAG: single-stranded DNA-binding protein [Candidatus Omnitrophica bacterium]|nr:single-stranded DNA-binding protein [Candidatus Omnitrophota bacterium]
MASLNKVFLIGNLTRDPELRYTPTGTAVVNFGIAVNRRFTDSSGEKKEEACFVRIVVFGKQAESCNQYLAKGRLVFVEGRLQYRSWEAGGEKKNSLDVVAERVQFLGTPKEEVEVVNEEGINSAATAHADGGKEEIVEEENPPF